MPIFGATGGGSSAERETEELRSKIARVSLCRPPVQAPATSAVVRQGNDLLESSYNVKSNGAWDGEVDVTRLTSSELQDRIKTAKTYEDWHNAADGLDILVGNHHWKYTEEEEDEEKDHDCDMELLRRRLDKLKAAINSYDIEEMVHLIRNTLRRDLANMSDVKLYQHCWVGTKHLIDEYTDVVMYTIEEIARYCETADAPTVDRYLSMMKEARQSFGNTALMLSGGGTLGMCHIGVVKSLLDQNLLPRVVCGSSAGSIVGSVLCTHKGEAIKEKLDELCLGDLAVFQGPKEIQGIPGMACNTLKGEPAFNVANLCRIMRSLLGDITFKEAFNLTGMILNIHVSSRDKHSQPRLLNYCTAPHVVIWSAVASSCALPGIFKPPGIKQKHPDTFKIVNWGPKDCKWIDGSIEGDLPSKVLMRLFNVNNFIASQVNPHVATFMPREGSKPTLLRRTMSMTMANAIYMLDGLMEYGWDAFPVKVAHSVLSQKYDGNVTIKPDISWVKFTKILANPSNEFMGEARKMGERATWPQIDRIRNSVAIELALDHHTKAIHSNKFNGTKSLHRTMSSPRTHREILQVRSSSSGPAAAAAAGLAFVPRIPRGRANVSAHRTVRSMVEPPALAALQAAEHIQSSSDELPSGQSSPTTSYEDEDFDDLNGDETIDTLQVPNDQSRLRAYLSQPTSPSISKKAFWGIDSTTGPTSPGSPEMKRTFGTFSRLQMSNMDSERKKPRHEQ